MKNPRTIDNLFYCFTIAASIVYFLQIPSVPFHPDESTQIYMSSDVGLFFQSPANLFWQKNPDDPLRQAYRELDAPITRILIGTGRWIFGLDALKSDWVWSDSWLENNQNGTLPEHGLLVWSRVFVAWLFPFSLLMLYEIGKALKSQTAGWAAAILFFINPLILLHTRRAMAESVLVFAVILSVYFLIKSPGKIWLVALPVALAFNAKQTAVGLLICGIVWIVYQMRGKTLKELFMPLIIFLGIFALTTLLLNPVHWANPIQSTMQAIDARQNLAAAQTGMYDIRNSSFVLDTYPQKMISLFGQLFILPLQFAETGNYSSELDPAFSSYGRMLLNNDLLFMLERAVLLGLTLVSLYLALQMAMRRTSFNDKLLFVITMLAVSSLALLFIPLSFQRYYVPLIPFFTILSGYSLSVLLDPLSKAVRARINR